jgi:hypothetical protein
MDKMRVFISWSGPRSRKVAACLHEYLPKVFHLVSTWMSVDDIRSGAYWSVDIRNSLGSAKVGIICLTPDNIESRWLLYESGALAHAVGGALVVPYLLGLRPTEIQGPLAQFQAVAADKVGTEKLFRDLNELLTEGKLGESSFSETFDVWWPRISECLKSAQVDDREKRTKLSERELLEEAVQHLRFLRRAEISRVQAELVSGPEIAKEIASWDKDKMYEFFERILQPEALNRARREYEYIALREETATVTERANELAYQRANELGVGEDWNRWRLSRRK